MADLLAGTATEGGSSFETRAFGIMKLADLLRDRLPGAATPGLTLPEHEWAFG